MLIGKVVSYIATFSTGYMIGKYKLFTPQDVYDSVNKCIDLSKPPLSRDSKGNIDMFGKRIYEIRK